jgi:hypothetical protein
MSERQTRKSLINPLLEAVGWNVIPMSALTSSRILAHHAVEEYDTDNGPAD